MNEPSNSPEPVSVSRAPASRSPRIGLVLGGGGASGLAFHAGVLWARSTP